MAGVKIEVARMEGDESWVASWVFTPEEVELIDVEETIKAMHRGLGKDGDMEETIEQIISKYLK